MMTNHPGSPFSPASRTQLPLASLNFTPLIDPKLGWFPKSTPVTCEPLVMTKFPGLGVVCTHPGLGTSRTVYVPGSSGAREYLPRLSESTQRGFNAEIGSPRVTVML